MSTLRLNTGDLKVSVAEDVLVTGGVGSCVVICIWDRRLKIGGMAHMCLPAGSGDVLTPGRSPDTAIPHLLSLLQKKGASRPSLFVTLAGGGNMFHGIDFGSASDVGFHIGNSTKLNLEVHGLALGDSSLGGRFGRAVRFCLATGRVDVTFTNGESITLRNIG